MVIQWGFDGHSMGIRWSFNGDSMEIQWRFNGDSMVIQWGFDGHFRQLTDHSMVMYRMLSLSHAEPVAC
jgi:hypothetical protein